MLVQLHAIMSIAMGVALTTYHLKGTNIVPSNCVVLKEKQTHIVPAYLLLNTYWVAMVYVSKKLYTEQFYLCPSFGCFTKFYPLNHLSIEKLELQQTSAIFPPRLPPVVIFTSFHNWILLVVCKVSEHSSFDRDTMKSWVWRAFNKTTIHTIELPCCLGLELLVLVPRNCCFWWSYYILSKLQAKL